ncbi:SCO family protein [Spirosoma koreense]
MTFFAIACQSATDRSSQALPYYNSPDFTPIFPESQTDLKKKVTHTIGPFSLTDQHGQTIDQHAIEVKIHVANFFFTTCGAICPRMVNNMKLVDKAFGHDPSLVLLSYSVMPWTDDVARLQKYALAKGIRSPNWHLLTGPKSAIYQLARQSYFAESELGYTRDSTEFLHTEHCLLVDKHKRIRGIYNGTLELEMHQLIADIRTLQQEE